jgi:hypothetical protein
MATRVCPAVRFAKSRNPKEMALAKYDTNSIKTNKGTNGRGVPAGTKNEKNLILCFTNAKIVTPNQTVILKPRQTYKFKIYL